MLRNIVLALLFTIALGNCLAQSTNKTLQYDAGLAQKLGADEYGMKTYIMVFLKAGPNRPADSVAREELQKAHLKNIMRLAAEGKLIVAGPFLDDQDIKGIFIFNVGTVDEAKKLADSDPAIKAGSLIMELHPWYGSAALVETAAIHKKIEKKSATE